MSGSKAHWYWKRKRRLHEQAPTYTEVLTQNLHGCKFIIGPMVAWQEPHWCGKRQKRGSPYCEEHHKLTHMRPPSHWRPL